MRPAIGGTLDIFEVQQASDEVRDRHVVDFGRLPVAFLGRGNLPCDRPVSEPKAVFLQKSETFVHSSRNAPSRFQPSPKFLSATVLKWVLHKTTSLERIHPTGEDKGSGCLDTLGRLGTVERTDEALSACGGLAFFILHSPFCIRFRVARVASG